MPGAGCREVARLYTEAIRRCNFFAYGPAKGEGEGSRMRGQRLGSPVPPGGSEVPSAGPGSRRYGNAQVPETRLTNQGREGVAGSEQMGLWAKMSGVEYAARSLRWGILVAGLCGGGAVCARAAVQQSSTQPAQTTQGPSSQSSSPLGVNGAQPQDQIPAPVNPMMR